MAVLEVIILWTYRDMNVEEVYMKYYSYVIPRDYGFAPNPYFGYCTLATCKPRIRMRAQIGDWIAAYGASGTNIHKKLVVLLKVKETLSFDQYWDDIRFEEKRPVFNRAIFNMYGDNIYHHIENQWIQEISHHSMSDGGINYVNLNHDTQVDRVLIATEFYYFGNNAIEIPPKFDMLIGSRRNYQICKNEETISELIDFVNINYEVGVHGVPYSKKSGQFAHYRGE